MTHAFISGLVVGWITLTIAELVAIWALERWIDRNPKK